MITANLDAKIPGSNRDRRFTVLWKTRGRDRRSAQMTEVEAQRFVDRLMKENAEAVRIDDTVPDYVTFRVT